MKWFKTEEKLPPYNENILLWIECEKCRDNVIHSHDCRARSYPIHGAVIGHYCKADPLAADYCKKEGRKEMAEKVSQDYWFPATPKYWCFIKTPYNKDNNDI